MSYNLAENSNLYSNTSSGTGNVALKVSEIVSISNLTGTSHISDDDILCLDCDLGARVKVDELRYYFSSTSSSGTVASGIAFYYKNDAPDDYSLLTTNINAGYYYTSVPALSAPRYLRVMHTVSGTSISGTVEGFNLLNEDETVDFGTDGTATSFAASTSVLGGSADIKTIPIYNSGTQKATAYVVLEPQGTTIDELVTLSTTSGGPWYGVKENAQILADEDTWSTDGNLDTTEVSSGLLQLQQNELSGTYTTRIFEAGSKNSYVYLDIYSEEGDSFATKDAERSVRTIEMRSSGQKPKDYALIRTFHYATNAGYRWLYYIDRHRDDGSTVYTSGYLSDGSHTSYNYYVRCAETDPITGRTVGFVYRTKYGFDWKQLRAFIIYPRGSYYDTVWVQRDAATEISNNCYDIRWDGSGGTWWLVYTNYSRSGYTLNQGVGYYLMHFANGYSSQTYEDYSTSRQCWDMSCDTSTDKLWYVDRNTDFVKLITSGGTEEVQYPATDPYGISAMSDGGCWFVNITDDDGGNLVHLDSDGSVVETLTGIGTSSLRRVAMDGDDAMYIIDGDSVKRISTDGTVHFTASVANVNKFLQVTDTGVWVRTSNNLHRFVTSAGEIMPTNISYSYLPAVQEFAFDDTGHGFHFPIPIDNHWQNLEWKEVMPDKYPVPIDAEYAQARITLRANRPSDLHAVDSSEIWTPEDWFSQSDGTAPDAHRWRVSDDTSAISALSNRMRFYGAVGGGKSIQSSHPTNTDIQKWYIDTGGTHDLDLQFYYRLDGPWNPPNTYHYIYMRLYALDAAYEGDYIEGLIRRRTNGTQDLYARINKDGTTYGSYNSYTAGNDYGYLRLHWDMSNDRLRCYDYISGIWQYNQLSNASNYSIGNTFYVWIYMPGHGAGNDVDIDSFIFNQNVDDVIFYDYVTPKVQNIYLQKSIEVPNIYPNTAKNAYMKLDIPDNDLGWAGSYNTNLKAWWEVPT